MNIKVTEYIAEAVPQSEITECLLEAIGLSLDEEVSILLKHNNCVYVVDANKIADGIYREAHKNDPPSA